MLRSAPPAVKLCIIGLVVLLALTTAAQAAYVPPIGIPAPPFGIDETNGMYDDDSYDFGSGPEAYPDAGNGPYTHYIDNTHPNATDTSNPYGSPTTPRMSLIEGNSVTFAAGSVVEIHGGPYVYAATWRNITSQGTSSRPVFIRGTDPQSLPQIRQDAAQSGGLRVQIHGSYLIIENLEFTGECIVQLKDGTDHLSIRSCEIENEGTYTGYGTAVSNSGDYNVVYNNYIHHNERAEGVDGHGTGTASGTSNLWILENHISHNSGDAFQAAHLAAVAPQYVYVGGNVMHDDRENGVDLKTIDDVVVSENIMYNYASSETSSGDAVVIGSNGYSEQYGPLRSWFLFNEIYSSQTGIRVEGAEDCWIIGNTIYDIVGDGIQFDIDVDSDNVNFIHNTISSVGGDGIHHHWKSGATNLRILSNIISDVGDAHIEVSEAMISAFTIEYNLFYQNGNDIYADWGTTDYYTQSASTLNAISGWANNVVGDPDFVDAASFDFHLDSSSAAEDAGTETDAYDDFYTLYSIDIEVDFDGTGRPIGSDWDIGAFENDGTGNNAPSVDAGSDDECTLPSGVTLDGTVTDDGLPDPPASFTVAWSKISGTGTVSFGDSTAIDTTATFSVADTYVLRLLADDNDLTNYDDVTIIVNAEPGANTAPSVDAGSDDECTLPSGVTLDGTVTDDGNPDPPGAFTVAWSKTSGSGTVTFGDSTAVDTTAGFSAADTYVLRLTADDSVLTDYDEVTISVNAAPLGTNSFQESGGTVVMEAENWMDNDTNGDYAWWTEETTYSSYAGDGYMEATAYWNGRAWSVAAKLGYDINFSTAGTYTIWVRRYALADNNNNAHVGLDGTEIGTQFDDYNDGYNTWTWINHDTDVYISAGTHSFELRKMSRSYRADKIILTTDTSYTPSGTGPAESSRGGGGGNSAPSADAGSDDSITLPSVATLDGTVTDDGLPDPPASVTTTWSKTAGPGTVTFGDSSAVDTTAGFSTAGTYVLQLEADDGDLTDTDTVQIVVAAASTAFQESGGTVVMECENYDDNDTSSDGSPWENDTSYGGYVGTGHMTAPSSGGSKSWSTGAALTYDIDFTTAGTYYIWVRRYADRAQENEAFVGLDGTQIGGTFDGYNGSYDQWYWQEHGTVVYISSGSHQFNLRRREKQYGVDRIILTDDSGYTPSGNGPAESSR